MRLEGILEEHGEDRWHLDSRRQAWEIRESSGLPRLRFRPPLVLPIRPRHGGIADYLEEDLEHPGVQLLLLIQAGAVAMGLWEEGELMAHKAFKKYVVRGKGKAQATHLGSKGKSRYGSRLRLQNWKAQLLELKERCSEWQEAYGDFELVMVSCPVRLWPELFAAEPLPPFDQREGIYPVPMDVAVPTHEELLRVRRATEQGLVELW